MLKRSAIRILILVFLFLPKQGFTQEAKPPVLDRSQQKVILDDVSKLLNENYIFPETATKMQELIQKS